MIERTRSEQPRSGRGGRRPGAGRKPNHLKHLAEQPITAAEIIARRHPETERLSPKELGVLHALNQEARGASPVVVEIKENQAERLCRGLP